ncbi:GNAT family N-acetyltransferase [Geomesophilobacter sediminis]|uniref:GNAT family N-acetyltransferase n=1 Tax=Geomesophilobacter sediminis TaxID=2798584 RepID=A0A8J7ISH7_9BACT|nr:GNAT family N-acetyltransferase [Geomesophilobacter sediminis]MBJ6726259.1 GNAT family N-acetyltransferase [Geomesophilobacter sediminis]
MGIAPFTTDEIVPFLALATEEGWLCDRWEFDFLLHKYPQGCFVWRENGESAGYVTSVRYGASGWIGNLLVPAKFRRKGIGRVLMEQAVATLLKDGAETVWLTASADGAGLYRKLGFVEIDTIRRWGGLGGMNGAQRCGGSDFLAMREIDRVGWGDKRDLILKLSLNRGTLFTTSAGYLCCQSWKNGIQVGPWGCLVGPQAGPLLDQAIGEGREQVFLDVPARNHTAAHLLQEKGFEVRGTNLLMYLGAEPEYRPETIFALASMGSMG